MSLRGSALSAPARGTVSLVALCFVAVLGISLAGYVTICSRAMTLSNRSFQASLGQQLAEFGIEEALRAFNKNDWSDWSNNGYAADWTLDTTNKRATATLTIPATKFGQGTTASVKIRVDNYDAAQKDSVWSNTGVYRINDIVGHYGIWYRSIQNANYGNTPGDLAWWVPEPFPWTWSKNNASVTASSDTSYAPYELINYNGIWYRCIASVSNTTNGSVPSLSQTWSNASVNYGYGDVVIYNTNGQAYRCISPHTSSASILPTNGTYWSSLYWLPLIASQPWASSTTYNIGDVVNYSGVQYRCTSPHTSTSSFAAANWSSSLSPISLSWSSSTYYARGSIVYYGGVWYYCRIAGSSSTTPSSDTSRWAPLVTSTGTAGSPTQVDPLNGTRYSVGDYVYPVSASGWRRCVVAHVTPASGGTWTASNWVSDTPYPAWAYRSSVSYKYNDVVYSNGIWYRRIGSTWENALSGGVHGWNSNSINYKIGDVVYYYVSSTSQWHRCIKAHTSSTSLTPSSGTYWSDYPLLPPTWEVNRNYYTDSLVLHGGIWFLGLDSSQGTNPWVASSTKWAAAPRNITAWDATEEYALHDVVSRSGTWYYCLAPHKNQAPPNATYWAILTGSSYAWNATTTYNTGNKCNYGGVWYQCVSGNAGQSPNNTTYWKALSAPVVYAEATINIANSPIKIQLRAALGTEALFPNAVASNTTLTITGGTGTVDSYDGSVASMNTGGTYNTYSYGQTGSPFETTANGNKSYSAVLAAGGTSSPSLSIGNGTDVKGYATANSSTSSPYAPLAIFGTSASVKGISSAASPNVDKSRVSRSPYIPQFDTLPANLTTAFANSDFPKGTEIPTPTTSGTTLNLGTPGATKPSRYFYDGSMSVQSGSSSSYQTININGPVILYINGSFRVRTSGLVDVKSTGSLEAHIKTYFRTESGSHGILNRTLDPKKLIIISDSTSSTSTYLNNGSSGTNSSFYGVVYIPNTTATDGFEVETGMTIYGALSAKKITFNAEANLHYDTSLRYATFGGVDQPYAVTEWRELPLTEQATMP